ncbi:hypothetical protein S83_004676, partial [Arachis hypogaea]
MVIQVTGYNFDIKYKAGTENRVADALSRKFHFSSLSFSMAAEWDDMEAEVLADEKLNAIMQKLLVGEETTPGFALMNGKLKYKGRLVLAKTSKWIPKILMEFHSSKLGGHSGFFRTYKRISAILYWEGMK